jgi:hypothetical protein
MKRVPLTAKWQGPITKRDFGIKAKTTAALSKHCGWGKPVVKLPKEGKQQ